MHHKVCSTKSLVCYERPTSPTTRFAHLKGQVWCGVDQRHVGSPHRYVEESTVEPALLQPCHTNSLSPRPQIHENRKSTP
jgi:hypothetical protein